MRRQLGLRLRVIEALKAHPSLRQLADEIGEPGLSYDTLLRIKNAEGDPGYSKVVRLALKLGLIDEAVADPVPTAAAA
jgi:hypothetical protein